MLKRFEENVVIDETVTSPDANLEYQELDLGDDSNPDDPDTTPNWSEVVSVLPRHEGKTADCQSQLQNR